MREKDYRLHFGLYRILQIQVKVNSISTVIIIGQKGELGVLNVDFSGGWEKKRFLCKAVAEIFVGLDCCEYKRM